MTIYKYYCSPNKLVQHVYFVRAQLAWRRDKVKTRKLASFCPNLVKILDGRLLSLMDLPIHHGKTSNVQNLSAQKPYIMHVLAPRVFPFFITCFTRILKMCTQSPKLNHDSDLSNTTGCTCMQNTLGYLVSLTSPMSPIVNSFELWYKWTKPGSIRYAIVIVCDRTYMGGISQDVKRLKMWDFYHLFFGFSWPFAFELLWWKLPCGIIS